MTDRKAYMKDYMAAKRANKDVNKVAVNKPENEVLTGGVNTPEEWYPNKPTDSKGKPVIPITLTDGQKFYPDPGITYPTVKKVTKGTKEAYSPSGGKISLDKLVDSGWRELINHLSTNLKPAYQEDLRIGVGGVTVSEARGLVECVS
jgi:hypothetical protein